LNICSYLKQKKQLKLSKMAQPTRRYSNPMGTKVAPTIARNAPGGSPMSYKTPGAELKAPTPKRIQLLLDNSADTDDSKDFVIFDALGFITEATKVANEPATQDMVSYSLLQKFMENAKLLISHMRVKATSSSNQFMNVMKLYVSGIDGNTAVENIHLEDSVSGNQYDQKIQTYNTQIIIGPRHGLVYTVDAGEKVYLTLNIGDIYSI
jgi:hypothetical protein